MAEWIIQKAETSVVFCLKKKKRLVGFWRFWRRSLLYDIVDRFILKYLRLNFQMRWWVAMQGFYRLKKVTIQLFPNK